MIVGIVTAVIAFIAVALTVLAMSARIVTQYESGIVFRFGRVLPGIRGPGLHR